MGKNLFITEKPSVAAEFAKALNVYTKRADGYMEDGRNIITWCVGHLVEMCYPEKYDERLKRWSLDTLPFIPQRYLYEPIEDVKKQYQVVKQMLNRPDVDRIYYSGDSAREGEYIQRLIRQIAGHNRNASEYRVWIDSQTDEEIKRGIREAKPLGEYDLLSDAAYARAIEDYLVGINFSRTLTLKYEDIANLSSPDGKRHPVAVGRVMSCVLGMVVNREREIRETKIFPFYGINALVPGNVSVSWKITKDSPYINDPDNYNNTGLLDKGKAENLLNRLNASGKLKVVLNHQSHMEKEAPLLFNLAELQAECTKRFHISPSQTLEIAQELYEKKLTTYPRTDARVLTTAVVKQIRNNIVGLLGDPEVGEIAEILMKNQMIKKLSDPSCKYVNDAAVSDHYAIIPTGQTQNANSLSPLAASVYRLITRRFLAVFFPNAKYIKQSVVLSGEGESFTGSATACTSQGFLYALGSPDNEDDAVVRAIGALSGTVPAEFTLHEGKTKVPSRYTSGSMILAMENAGKLIEDEELRETIRGSGIGTSATRADVIKKLVANQYIQVTKGSQVLSPTKFGEMIYEVLKSTVPTILNPAYTASWENGLAMIEQGKVSQKEYLEKINAYIANGVNRMKLEDKTAELEKAHRELDAVYGADKSPAKRTAGTSGQILPYKCPFCGKQLMESAKSPVIYCPGFSDKSCGGFQMTTKLGVTSIPGQVLHFLLTTLKPVGDGSYLSDVTDPVPGFVSKKGNPYSPRMQFEAKPGHTKINFIRSNDYGNKF